MRRCGIAEGGGTMRELRDALERLEPIPAVQGDWDAVLRDANTRPRRRVATPLAGVALAAAALFALALFQPWEVENPTFLERALAAVDDGPVLHVVLRGEWGRTLVDLETGERRPVHGESEVWYDPDRGLVHTISRLGESVQHERVYDPGEPPAELLALGREYREALQSGSARVAGEGAVDGEPVTWITIRSKMLPDSADGNLHEWAQQVAVSHATFRPVAIRDTRDGWPGPGAMARVLELEMLPAGQGDFTAPARNSIDGMAYSEGREPIARDAAARALGRTPLWLGRSHAGLPFAQASRTTTRTGRQEETLLTGPAAKEALACQARVERVGRRTGPDCDSMRGRRQSLVIRGDKVYALGPAQWGQAQTGVVFLYGTVGDDPSTFREDAVPLWDRPHVSLAETTSLMPGTLRAGSFVPPDGSVFIGAGGRVGSVRVDGVYVSIQASSEDLILSAARALEPMVG
jgi:hypothetical protein